MGDSASEAAGKDDGKVSVIIIGAGLFGLSAATVYRKLTDSTDYLILDSESAPGGTWTSARVYPNLLCQQPCGAYEYPDHPLVNPATGTRDFGTYGNFIPGTALRTYLEEYTAKQNHNTHIRFNTTVVRVEKLGTLSAPLGWALFVENGRADGKPDYVCEKLIVATGMTNEPHVPRGLDTSRFSGPVMHSKYLGRVHEFLHSHPDVRSVTVYGGGKSAVDTVQMCVQAGRKVDWVCRPDDETPGMPYFGPGMLMGRNIHTVVSSRFNNNLHPSLFRGEEDWWYRNLHSGKNRLLFWLHGVYWWLLSLLVYKVVGYDKSENGRKLKPQIKPRDGLIFWVNQPPAVITDPTLTTSLEDPTKITVHRATITSAESDMLTLTPSASSSSSDTNTTSPAGPLQLRTDALLLCTGYVQTSPFFSHDPDLSLSLGQLLSPHHGPSSYIAKWNKLISDADQHITRTYPRLASPPPIKIYDPAANNMGPPQRLYRHTVPVEYIRNDDRSIIFIGCVGILNMAVYSLLGSLWGVAWLLGEIDVVQGERGSGAWEREMEKVERDVALHEVWSKRRYLNVGARMPVEMYEFMPYFDALLKDLGIEEKRKGGGWRELFEEYGPSDYAGVLEEYARKARGRREERGVEGK